MIDTVNKLTIPFVSITLLLAILFPKEAVSFSLSASGAVLMEQESGRVLYEKNGHKIQRIASDHKNYDCGACN